MEMNRTNWKLAVGFPVAVAAGVLAAWNLGEWRAAGGMQEPGRMQATLPGPASTQSAGSWFSAVGGPPSAAAEGSSSPPPLSRQVDALIATRQPEDAYKAFLLISECITFQRLGTIPLYHFPERREMSQAEIAGQARICASLTEQLRRSRLDYLATAAKAGVPGASTAFLMAGPFGDHSATISRPDDPLVLQWKQQALAQLTSEALQGDTISLSTLWSAHMVGMAAIPKDVKLAYTYQTAMESIYRLQNPGENNGGPYEANLFGFLKDGLTPEQIAKADAEAARITENFRARSEAEAKAGASQLAGPQSGPASPIR